jgi:pyruvate dehydrogenase E2 component (dihydrolipoamide acetyltransferase)
VDEGILGRILVPAGTQGVKVNDVIAVLVEAGEAVPAAGAAPKAAAAPAATPAPVAAPVAVAPAPVAAPASGDRVFASPLARRMAAQAGVDISKIAGSGPNGRIVKADVDAALSRGPAPASAAAPAAAPAPIAAPRPAAPVAITAPHTAVPNSSMRKVIARRLAESKATIPHFYVSTDVEIDALLKIRADLNARSPKDGPGAYKLSVNDLVIKATAVTLRRFPNVNSMWTEDAILQLHDVDISVAVSIPDGLITPIVKGADIKGLAAISNEMKDLAARAKSGKLKPEEFQGGGFSISNMGMYGVRDFAAIINPPQAGILAVSAGEQRPVVKNGALAIATVMTLTLSVDHRVIDGALAAEFLQALKRNIEDPLSLML